MDLRSTQISGKLKTMSGEHNQSQIPHIPILLKEVKSEPADEEPNAIGQESADVNTKEATGSKTLPESIKPAEVACASTAECHQSTEDISTCESTVANVGVNNEPQTNKSANTESTSPIPLEKSGAGDTTQPSESALQDIVVKQEHVTENCNGLSAETQPTVGSTSAAMPAKNSVSATTAPMVTIQGSIENNILLPPPPAPAAITENAAKPIIKEEPRSNDADIQSAGLANGEVSVDQCDISLQPHLPPPQTERTCQPSSTIATTPNQETGIDDLTGLATPIRCNFLKDATDTNRSTAPPPLAPFSSLSQSAQSRETTSMDTGNIKEEPRSDDTDAYLSGLATPLRYNFTGNKTVVNQRAAPPMPSTSMPHPPSAPPPPPPPPPAPTTPPPQSSPTHDQTANTTTEDEPNSEAFTDNFFDDLLQDADAISAAIMSPQTEQPPSPTTNLTVKREPTAQATEQRTNQSEVIPSNFFDDLLVDRVAERLEDAVNQDIEMKYSERLKELHNLEQLNKSHKKHKKKKKKSHKRDNKDKDKNLDGNEQISRKRSRRASQSPNKSLSPPRLRVKTEFMENRKETQRIGSLFPHEVAQPLDTATTKSQIIDLAAEPSGNHSAPTRQLLRVKPEFNTFPAVQSPPSVLIDVNEDDLCLPVKEKELFTRRPNRNGLVIDMAAPLGFKRIKLEKDVTLVPNIAASLTPKAKREQAYNRAIAAIEEFKKAHRTTAKPLNQFVYTSIVRKLPQSSSYVTQQIYENRSPLHQINNVSFKFNSHATHYNLREWGIEAIPSVSAKVAKVLGYDALTLFHKLKSTKLPSSLQKLKNTIDLSTDTDESHSTYIVNSATQTDEVTILSARRRNGFDIGVQATPYNTSVGTQTKEIATTSGCSYDDLPLMQQISLLNENQLMALSDFAELIRESASSAMDMYRLRQRMLDIYKCSQLPSAMPSNQPKTSTTMRSTAPAGVNYVTMQEQRNSVALPNSYAPGNAHYQHAMPVAAPLPTPTSHAAANYSHHGAYQHMPEQYVPQPVISYPGQQHEMLHATQPHNPTSPPHVMPVTNDPRFQQSRHPAPSRANPSIYYGRGNMRR